MKLVDCYCEIISYTLYFLKDPKRDDVSCIELKEKYDLLIARSKEMAEKSGFKEIWEQGFFPICALVDEFIMNSEWKNKREWIKYRLQVVYFHTSNAGEEFFARLNSMEEGSFKEVREVYLYCLALGFRGKYFRESDEGRLEDLIYTNLKRITDNTDLALPKELFPEAYEPDIVSKQRKKPKWRSISLFSVLIVILPALFLAGLYYFYNYKLDMLLSAYFNNK
ncbi:MAG: DotU family type IV/VI secretion system protein [Desulfonauticus sp.]|nr:DotU family type IV/VI secretion system protein [Desulfonauticus sp.]